LGVFCVCALTQKTHSCKAKNNHMIISNDHNNWRKKTRFKVFMMFILARTNLVFYFGLKLFGHRHTYMQRMDQNHPL
jgi:hypothetical protein